MEDLIKFAEEFIAKNPSKKREVIELLQFCSDEIAYGGSPEHERQLCEESIEQLLEDVE